jgi:hypothetical protein
MGSMSPGLLCYNYNDKASGRVRPHESWQRC